MLAVHTILHPTEPSGFALGLACSLTRDYGARLVVLHVTNPPSAFAAPGIAPLIPEDLRAEARDRLDRLPMLQDDVRAERRLEEGGPVAEILRVAYELPTDLIVMAVTAERGCGGS
jgi:nucleotide-binding universal stress UspA family protein